MAPIAGWYDDPRDGQRLRYWDGEAWTDHVTDKRAAAATSESPVFPGGEQAQQQTWNYGQPAQPPPQATAPPQQGSPQPGPPAPYPQQTQQYPTSPQQSYPQPPYPQPPYPQQQPFPPSAGYPAWHQPSAPPPGAVLTPDGALVTSWVKRVAARLLDNIFVFFGTLPLTGYFFYRVVDAQSKAMDAGTYHPFSITDEVRNWELGAVAIIVVAQLVYEAVSLRRWGATPGKRVLNLSVRPWGRGGLLPWATIARRLALVFLLWLATLVPVLGALALIALILDYLWPLWDKRHQALHDKLAGTVVIEGARRETG
jgi:uncharacterized RDD family membrane protein YckC